MNRLEEWRDVRGYEGFYQVSNLGRVKSIGRYVGCKGYVTRFYPGRIMKQDTTRGYKRCTLSKNNITKRYQVHRLVAVAFIENPKGLPFVNHKDENPSNNNVDNLEWCTPKYNSNYGTCIERRIKHSDFHKRAIKQYKPVYQYDLNGNLIRIWGSIKEACESGYCRDKISKCCNGHKESYKGFIWSFEEKCCYGGVRDEE